MRAFTGSTGETWLYSNFHITMKYSSLAFMSTSGPGQGQVKA